MDDQEHDNPITPEDINQGEGQGHENPIAADLEGQEGSVAPRARESSEDRAGLEEKVQGIVDEVFGILDGIKDENGGRDLRVLNLVMLRLNMHFG